VQEVLLQTDFLQRGQQISKAYEIAEDVKECLGCGYDENLDGRIVVSVDGKKYYVKCPVMTQQCRYGQYMLELMEKSVLDHVRSISGVPSRFHQALESPRTTSATSGVDMWLESKKNFLLLHGSHGCGKSFGAAYALKMLDRKALMPYWDKKLLWQHIRVLWTSSYLLTNVDDVFREAQFSPFLIIDDLGSEESTSRARGRISEVISARYDHCRLTIITSNDDAVKIGETYGRRVYTRITESGMIINCGERNLRLE